MCFASGSASAGRRNLNFGVEIFNVLTPQLRPPGGNAAASDPGDDLTETNRVQPGQPYTAAAAESFGRLTSTVGRTVGLGTKRQVQFALRLSF